MRWRTSLYCEDFFTHTSFEQLKRALCDPWTGRYRPSMSPTKLSSLSHLLLLDRYWPVVVVVLIGGGSGGGCLDIKKRFPYVIWKYLFLIMHSEQSHGPSSVRILDNGTTSVQLWANATILTADWVALNYLVMYLSLHTGSVTPPRLHVKVCSFQCT